MEFDGVIRSITLSVSKLYHCASFGPQDHFGSPILRCGRNGSQRGFVTEGLVSSPETSRRHGVRQELPESAFIWAGIMPKRVGIPNMMECQPVLA